MKRRILIVKIGAIGDVVMAMEAFSYFQKEKVTWVVGKTALALLQKVEGIEKLVVVDEEKLFQKGLFSSFKELIKIQRELFFSFFDATLILHRDWRYRLFSLWSFSKKVAFLQKRKKKRLYSGFSCKWPIFTKAESRDFGALEMYHLQLNPLYHAEEYKELLQKEMKLEPFLKPKFPFFPLPKPLIRKRAVVLAPGGAKNVLQESRLRRWPISSYVALAKKLEKENIPVILIGSDQDRWVLESFQGVAYENCIASFSLEELVSFLKNPFLLVSHDSAPLHLAKMVNCLTIALFGPTNPSEFCGNHSNIQVLWGGAHLSCRPCYDGKSYPDCPYPSCLASISVEMVFDKIVKLWKQL